MIENIIGIPLIIALTEVFKRIISDKRWYPLLSIAVGTTLSVVGYLAGFPISIGHGIFGAVLNGIILGLAASGLYSSGSTFKSHKNSSSPPESP